MRKPVKLSNQIIDQPPLTLLIDGNNLAHHLYPHLLPGQKMTINDSRQLITHMSHYALTYPTSIMVELCLDRFPGDAIPLPPNLTVRSTSYPQTADEVLLSRFEYFHHTATPALVITNDQAVIDDIEAAGGKILRVFDFVRRAGIVDPVFREPAELLQIAHQPTGDLRELERPELMPDLRARITSASQISKAKQSTASFPQSSVLKRPHLKNSSAANEIVGTKRNSNGQAHQPVPEVSEPRLVPAELATASVCLTGPENISPTAGNYFYRLTLETWPPAAGIRFLLDAFCPRHSQANLEMIELFANLNDPNPADVADLARLLRQACGDEPDFARRGALMTRVRLALLQAGRPLTESEIAQITGLKLVGLRGRIKHKAEPWVQIDPPHSA